jgi:hypothetical protein
MKFQENQKTLLKAVTGSAEQVAMNESFKKRFGIDANDKENFPVQESGFSFKKAFEKVASKFSEAEVSSSFAQLLRSGIQTIVNGMYETVPLTFEQWVTVTQSKKDTELYAPLHGIAFPREVAQGGRYPEVKTQGMDIKLQNRKFGSMWGVSWELSEDDQSGQIQTQSRLLGEYMKVLLEVLCYGKLAGLGAEYADYKIPACETKPSDESAYPWSVALQGGGKNRPASFGALTQPNIQAAFTGLRDQKNLLGLRMNVDPDTLLISALYEFDAAVLANSSFYPSVAGTVAGTTGGQFSINPIQGKFKPIVTRYMFNNLGKVDGYSKAWYLIDAKKPWFVCQIREAASVINENPASGASFDLDIMRFKCRMRANADHIDSRFGWQGNDGSI